VEVGGRGTGGPIFQLLTPIDPFFHHILIANTSVLFRLQNIMLCCVIFLSLPATLGIPLPAPSFLAGSHPSVLLPVCLISDQNYHRSYMGEDVSMMTMNFRMPPKVP